MASKGIGEHVKGTDIHCTNHDHAQCVKLKLYKKQEGIIILDSNIAIWIIEN
jgi:hypothetical protein